MRIGGAKDVEPLALMLSDIGQRVYDTCVLVRQARENAVGIRNDSALRYEVPVETWQAGKPIAEWVALSSADPEVATPSKKWSACDPSYCEGRETEPWSPTPGVQHTSMNANTTDTPIDKWFFLRTPTGNRRHARLLLRVSPDPYPILELRLVESSRIVRPRIQANDFGLEASRRVKTPVWGSGDLGKGAGVVQAIKDHGGSPMDGIQLQCYAMPRRVGGELSHLLPLAAAPIGPCPYVPKLFHPGI